MGYLIVFLGGGFGSAARHGFGLLAMRLIGTGYPVGTFAINLLGSFLMGVVAEYFALKGGLSQQLRLFLTTGIIGGFTTFRRSRLKPPSCTNAARPPLRSLTSWVRWCSGSRP